MLVQTNLDLDDSVDWVIEYCETGSSLTVVNKVGRTMLSLQNIPPAKLELLLQRLNEEFAKGIMVDPITKRRRVVKEMPLHPEGM